MTLKNQAIQTALQGNWQNAIALNKSLIAENPQDIDALNRLALAYTITGNLKEAKSTYQKVLEIDSLNSIAIRNLKKLSEKGTTLSANTNITTFINNKFLEEPGKTKVVDLINIAQPKITENLRTGQSLILSIKRLKIFALENTQYIGVLPDDIARRLIKFIKGGSVYEAYIKSANPHKVTIFIKEIKKSARFKDLPSFTTITESPLSLSKENRLRLKENRNEEEAEEEESYSEEE